MQLGERNHTMSQANGLRIIAPFSNAEIAEFAFNLPWEMKAYKNREKGLLRHAFEGILPESVAWRKKSPFPKTYNPEYMRLVMSKLSEMIESPDCRLTQIYDKKKLSDLIASEGRLFGKNWFGQLMSVPQIFAYLIQVEFWFKEFDAEIIR